MQKAYYLPQDIRCRVQGWWTEKIKIQLLKKDVGEQEMVGQSFSVKALLLQHVRKVPKSPIGQKGQKGRL